jgi:hypothetical protein
VAQKIIEYQMGDDRDVKVEFTEGADGVLVRETFDAESETDRELQRQGWQAIWTISPGMLKRRAFPEPPATNISLATCSLPMSPLDFWRTSVNE